SVHAFHRERKEALVFVLVEHVCFAGRSGHDEALRAAFQLMIDQARKRAEIQAAVQRERRHHRAQAAVDFQRRRRRSWKTRHLSRSRAGATVSRSRGACGRKAAAAILNPIFINPILIRAGRRSLNRSAPRPTADHHLLIQTVSPATHSPLLALAKRIADAGCNLIDSRVSTIGADTSVVLLAQGAWDAIAKLENALTRIGRDEEVRLLHYRTQPRDAKTHL